MKKVDMWLDDIRPPPDGWVWVKHVWEAIALIKRKEVRHASLDHDLGAHEKSGYDLCVWMARHGKWTDEKPTVHSQNPVGRFAMQAVIDRYYGRDERDGSSNRSEHQPYKLAVAGSSPARPTEDDDK